MNTENHITPDELFNSALGNFEVPFEEAAWIDMRQKLDKQDTKRPYFLLPFIDSEQKLNTCLAMITTSILAIISYFATNNSNNDISNIVPRNNHNNPKPAVTQNGSASKTKLQNSSVSNDAKEKDSPIDHHPTGSWKVNPNPVAIGSMAQPSASKTAYSPYKNNQVNKLNSQKVDGISNDQTAKNTFQNFSLSGVNLFRPNWSASLENTQYSFNKPLDLLTTTPNLKPSGKSNLNTMRYGSLGLYFTGQAPYQDSASFLRKSFGFNMEVNSKNLLESDKWAAYMGIDWGMQWYGHSPNTIVALNTTNADSGFTRLNMTSMDFLINGKLELGGNLPFHPYLIGFAGPRLYFWQQYTKSFIPLKDYESSSSNNAHTSATINYGAGIGARVRLSQYVHLDARATVMKNSNLKMVDMDKSSFDGLKYNLVTKFHEPSYYQLRLGVIFEFRDDEDDDDNYYRSNNNNATQNNQQQFLYYYLDSAGHPVKCVPCPCSNGDSAKVADTTSSYYNEMKNTKMVRVYKVPVNVTRGSGTVIYGSGSSSSSGSVNRIRRNGSSGSIYKGSSGSSSKGSFPGIKSGGARISPRS